MTRPIKTALLGGLIAISGVFGLVTAAPADERGAEPTVSSRVDSTLSSAQRRDRTNGGRREDGGLLDDIGLSSLSEIPWDAFGLGIVMSALVGAGGGFIYAGIAEPKDKEGA